MSVSEVLTIRFNPETEQRSLDALQWVLIGVLGTKERKVRLSVCHDATHHF
jgi:hypothetical protein